MSLRSYQKRVYFLSNFWTCPGFPVCAGVPPHKLRAELSANLYAGLTPHSSSWTPGAYEPHEVLLLRLFSLRQCDRKQRVRLLRSGRAASAVSGTPALPSLVRSFREVVDSEDIFVSSTGTFDITALDHVKMLKNILSLETPSTLTTSSTYNHCWRQTLPLCRCVVRATLDGGRHFRWSLLSPYKGT